MSFVSKVRDLLLALPVPARLFMTLIVSVIAGALVGTVLFFGHDGIGAIVGIAGAIFLVIKFRGVFFAPRKQL